MSLKIDNGITAEPARIRNLKLPERAPMIGNNVRDADIELLSHSSANFVDTTHFDTVRFPPPPWAIHQFSNAAQDGSLAYTGYRGHPLVLKSVSEAAGNFLGYDIDPKHNILLTPGTQAGLFAVLSSSIEKGDKVAVVDPDYLFTARILRFLDCDIVYIPMQTANDGPSPNLHEMEKAFASGGVKHLVFSHPNNPTGAVYSPQVIRDIAKLVEQFNIHVVVDELYSRLIYNDASFTHLAAEPGLFKRVVTLLGPSKTESLSGYRLGVVVGSRTIIERAENVLSITSLRAPAYAQHVLLPWLRDDQKWLDDRILEFNNLRNMTFNYFSQLPWLKTERFGGTAYAWVDVSALNVPDLEIAIALLEKANVLVSPGYQFGPSGKGHFRVCYARDEKEWEESLKKIVRVLKEIAIEKNLSGILEK